MGGGDVKKLMDGFEMTFVSQVSCFHFSYEYNIHDAAIYHK